MPDTPSHVFAFSTDKLPEKDRYDTFVEEYARKQYRIDVRRYGDAPFHSHMRMAELGRHRCMEVQYSAASYGRTPALTLDGNDDFMIPLCAALPFNSSNPDLKVAEGQGVLIDLSNSGFMANTTGGTLQMFWMPRAALMNLVPGAEDKARGGSVSGSVEMRLLSSYISTLLSSPPISAATLQIAGSHMFDLVALAFGASGDGAHNAIARGLRAARLLGVRQTINTRLHEPGLSLTDVAKDNAISERYVQRLFEGVDTSFSNYLLEQRLELALRLLTNPLQRHRRISDIATEAGFGDLSHFNRSFRQRFGDTPSGVRSRMTGD